MSKYKDMQRALHHYRQVTGEEDVEMATVARWAVEHLGMELPKPMDPYERLAGLFSKAARAEMRTDSDTGRPYRANHMVFDKNGQRVWFDLDDKPSSAEIAPS